MLGKSGNTIWFDFGYGPFIWHSYTRITFDENWNTFSRESLEITYIYDLSEMPEDWIEANPDMAEKGLYFHMTTVDNGLIFIVDEAQFMEAFEEMTGFSFDYVRPYWMVSQ